MYVIREVLNCKPGKVGELKKKFRAVSAIMEVMDLPTFRLLTDVSGEPYWTLVAEIEVESLDAFGEIEDRVMGDPAAREAMSGYHDLVQAGRREIYRLES